MTRLLREGKVATGASLYGVIVEHAGEGKTPIMIGIRDDARSMNESTKCNFLQSDPLPPPVKVQ